MPAGDERCEHCGRTKRDVNRYNPRRTDGTYCIHRYPPRVRTEPANALPETEPK